MKDLHDLTGSIINSNERAHAYIIEGRPGDARDSFVDAIVTELTGSSFGPDAVYMQKSGKSSYKVSDASAFCERLSMRPYGKFLVGIIDDAGSMSEIIQNKLLKTLEEPADGVIILLPASKADELLGTVRSRCTVVRTKDYNGYSDAEDDEADGDFMEGVLMLLTQRHAFYEFREFTDKHIKSNEDALRLISLAETRLRDVMTEGKAVSLCADRIEMAEKATEQIMRGMDKSKAVKKLFLDFSSGKTYRV